MPLMPQLIRLINREWVVNQKNIKTKKEEESGKLNPSNVATVESGLWE